MPKRRSTFPPVNPLSAAFAVRIRDQVEVSKDEDEAWTSFLRLCHDVPSGTKVELLRKGKVCAQLTSTGTWAPSAVLSLHAPPPILA